jgi:hypothetical protein
MNLQVSFFSVLTGFLYVLKCRKSVSIVMVISNLHWQFPRKKQPRSCVKQGSKANNTIKGIAVSLTSFVIREMCLRSHYKLHEKTPGFYEKSLNNTALAQHEVVACVSIVPSTARSSEWKWIVGSAMHIKSYPSFDYIVNVSRPTEFENTTTLITAKSFQVFCNI